MTIVLMGFMGAGKTTVGQLLAGKLGLAFVDVDLYIEKGDGRAIRDIFAADGEAEFRRLEHEAVVELLAGPEAVIALGGGAVEHEGTRKELRNITSVHLEVSYEEALRRIGTDDLRPMVARPDIEEIYRRRLPVYRAAARISVATDGRAPEEVVAQILELGHNWSSGWGRPVE